MAISAYPRTAIQGTPGAGNISNGLSLMLINPSTGNYEPATANTFSGGGGGGGDATAANQSTQIAEAQTTNQYLFDNGGGLSVAQSNEIIKQYLIDSGSGLSVGQSNEIIKQYLIDNGRSVAQLLFNTDANRSVAQLLQTIINTLQDGTAKVQIVDSSGNGVNVSSNRLNVDTGA
jgi:hypothetical protein